MIRFNDKDNISPELLALITNIGIDHEYPILMGQTMKYFIQNNYQVPEKTFKSFKGQINTSPVNNDASHCNE